MRVLGRLVVGAFALLLAVPAGAAVLAVALILDPGANAWLAHGALAGLDAALSDLSAGLPPEAALGLALALSRVLFALLVLPPALVGLAGEVLGRRGLVWYGGGCGLLTAALPWLARGALRPGPPTVGAAEGRLTLILFAVGASAGLVYWLVAGRGAGTPSTRSGSAR